MIDLKRQSKSIPNYEIKPSDLENWEAKHGTIPDGAVVLIQTGWGDKSSNIEEYTGLDEYQKFNTPGKQIYKYK